MLDYIYDDGGRRNAGYKGDTGDCVVRAAAIVLDYEFPHARPHYQTVYDAMAAGMKAAGYVASGNAYAQKPRTGRAAKNKVNRAGDIQVRVLRSLGFEKAKLPTGPRPTYAEALRDFGPCIVSTRKHMAALVNGALRDTFDGRSYQMLVPYCLDCAPNWYMDRKADASGAGYECSWCQTKCDPTILFMETRERKAMSVWILPE